MGTYNCTARSNYFRVHDPEKFRQLCEKYDLTMISKEVGKEVRYGFLNEGGDLDPVIYDEGATEPSGNFLDELTKHIVPGDVAILMEIGYEKMRYLNGAALAVSSKGIEKNLNIHDIYTELEKLGFKDFTACEY